VTESTWGKAEWSLQEASGIPSANSKTHLSKKSALSHDYHRRTLVAELALFVHGSVVSAITGTLQLFSLPNTHQDRHRSTAKFESLLKWKDTCAVCGTSLSLPEGELPSGAHSLISIGMRDIRMGNYQARSTVSANRGDVYFCFAEFVSGDIGWSHGLGPYFFYFGELYHRSCKPFRGKETSLA